jgi:large subunit ribosomal protein L4
MAIKYDYYSGICIIMRHEIINLDNEIVDNVTLPESIFGLPLRVDILNSVVKWQRSLRQTGNHHTRLIHEISGTTKKPWKQKGTGRARVGSLRVPHFRGGATMFGPRVRDHSHKLPKKVRRLGLKTALSCKKSDNHLIILNELANVSFKTKDLFAKLNNILVGKSLFVCNLKENHSFAKASSNIKNLNIISEEGINVYDILCHDNLVLTRDAFVYIERKLC